MEASSKTELVSSATFGELLVVRLLSRDNRRVRSHAEVDAWVRDQVGLELGDVNVQRAVEAQGSGER